MAQAKVHNQAKVHYLVDDKGNRTAVQMPIKEYEELMEDMQALALVAKSRNEATEPWEAVKKRLDQKWRRMKPSNQARRWEYLYVR